MPDNDPPDTPDDDLEDLEDITEAIGDEIPGVGTARRLYRLIKKRLSKEYRKEISRLRKKEKILIKTIDQQNQSISDLRKYIDDLERRLKELEDNAEPDDNEDPNEPILR